MDPRTRERLLVLGFLDRSRKPIQMPSGVLPPAPNRVSLIVDEAREAGVVRVGVRNGVTELYLRGSDEQNAAFRGRISAALENLYAQPVRGVAMFHMDAQSDWAKLIDSSPCVVDPENGSLTALSLDDLEATLERVGALEKATTIRDANLAYIKSAVVRNGGEIRRTQGGDVIARFATVAGAEAVRPALEKARAVDPARKAALVQALEQDPLVLQAVLPGVLPEQIAEALPTDRAGFDALAGRSAEALRRFNDRKRALAREVGRSDLDERLALLGENEGRTRPLTGPDVQRDLGNQPRTEVEGELNSLTQRREGTIENSVARRNREEAESRRIKRNRVRAAESADLATATLVEAQDLKARVENSMRRYPEDTPYGNEVDLVARLGRNAERAAQGDGRAYAWSGRPMILGTFNMVVVSKTREWAIIPYSEITQHCVGVTALRNDVWHEGLPDEKTLKGWVRLGATLQINYAEVGRASGIRIYGERPQTIENQLKRAARQDDSLEAALFKQNQVIERLFTEDALRSRAEAVERVTALFGPQRAQTLTATGEVVEVVREPMTYSLQDLRDSMTVSLGDGTQQSVGIAAYPGIVVAQGVYHTQIYSDGAIYTHLRSAIGEHEIGTTLKIGYEAGSNMEWAHVTEQTTPQNERIAEKLRELIGRFDDSISEEKYLEHIDEQSIAALNAAQLLGDEGAQITFSMPDPEQAIEPITFEGEIVHATPHAGFLLDHDKGVVVPIRADVTKPLAVGDAVAYTVNRVGTAIVRHTPAEQVVPALREATWVAALKAAREQVVLKVEREALAETLSTAVDDLVELDARALGNRRAIVKHALTTNNTVYAIAPIGDTGKIGYIALPAWDKFGERDPLSWEIETVGFAGVSRGKGSKLEVEPLLVSQREALGLERPTSVPHITIDQARLRMQVVADAQTLELKGARYRDTSVPARFLAADDRTVTLDVSSATEKSWKVQVTLERAELDLDVVDALTEGQTVTISTRGGVLSLDGIPSLPDNRGIDSDGQEGGALAAGGLGR